ncbi:MAG: hypothetical protein M5U26_14215 [Planctomycetota bacterium]|nr:hypothetical protein [Planctomycetota bacterium]
MELGTGAAQRRFLPGLCEIRDGLEQLKGVVLVLKARANGD